jgi:NitT/TauT family transport system ATP-binding protein
MGAIVMDIVVKNVCKSFGDKKVLENFNACFSAGSRTCIMGPSGCGKTTLAHILLGIVKPDSGSVEGILRKMSAVFQEDRLSEDFSVLSNVRMVTEKSVSKAEIEACFSALGLEKSIHLPVRELSGGMKRRVAIARALLTDSDLIVMDEPFKGLDDTTKQQVISYIRQKTAGKTLLLISHDEEDAPAFEANILRMESIS